MNDLDQITEPSEVLPDDDGAALALPRVSAPKVLAAAMAVLTVGMITFGVLFWREAEADKADVRERDAAVRAAEEQALTLTNVNRRNIDEQMDQLIKNGTGEFLRQFNATASTFRDVVVKSKVRSTSTVAESGVVEFSDNKAVVLVALESDVRNQQTGKDEPRPYRITVDLVNEDGAWLVEQMEFVQ